MRPCGVWTPEVAAAPGTGKERKERIFGLFGFSDFFGIKKSLSRGFDFCSMKMKKGKGEKGKSSVFATARFGVFANVLLVASLCKSGKPVTFSRFAL